jgi:hypothetical protein
MSKHSQLELYKEYPEPGEAELTRRLITLLLSMIRKSYLTGTTYRDTHAKGHCVVQAEFTVEPDLPEELRVGLFSRAGTYPSWIRFANTSPNPQPDKKGDVRSLSIKLMGVDGEKLWQDDESAKTLDFIMMGVPKFLTPNLTQFYDMEVALDKGGLSQLWFFLTHPRVAWTVFSSFKKCASLIEVPYFSQTAYLFGKRAVQYHIKPHQPPTSKVPRNASKNFLREQLQKHLATSDASFDFMVQFQTDPRKMPIEDPNVFWDPALSPYRKVATIRIPSQRCDTPAHVAFAENISFNPWRTLPEHRPLGGINRARREVYPVISQFRHYRNSAQVREPAADGSYPNLADSGFPEPASNGAVKPAKRHTALKIAAVVLILVAVGAGIFIYRLVNPPHPPTYQIYRTNELHNVTWTREQRQRYYHLSQGSQIMPYDWFVALEQAGNRKSFTDTDNMVRYRLVPDTDTLNNPDRLPVGFAKDDPDPITKVQNVGLTCATCHTGQLVYNNVGFQIDGAPGKVDFDGFIQALILAVGDTLINPLKFDAFAKKVLKDQNTKANAKQLKLDVQGFLTSQSTQALQETVNDFLQGGRKVKGGYGRLDALGAGGNRLYRQLGKQNLRTLNAPVKALPLWYTHNYNWVQTNGSIRQPMARNMIEALAVNASLVFPEPAESRYISSVRLLNMSELENTVATFKAPTWPSATLGQLNEDAVKRGEVLYQQHCASCHDPQMEDKPEPGDKVAVANNKTYFVVPIIPLREIKTDPLDATNFAERRLDASAINMGSDVAGAEIIALVLSSVMTRQYQTLGIPVEKQNELNGFRDNLLRGCLGYPARPLAGVWATSPYLHNGSIPNLYQLLLPAAQRVRKFYTGDLEFDPVNVGYVSDGKRGGFPVDTSIPGNSNSGHEYGTSLTHQQRMDLIEYLKALVFPDGNYKLVPPQAACPA